MARVLAFDIGLKRTGLAVTDDFQLIASGLTTVETPQLIPFLQKYLAQEKVVAFVIGEPKQLDGSPSESDAIVRSVANKIQTHFPDVPQRWIDERFTSKMASQSMLASGMKKKQRQNKGTVDEIAATILLQDYLNRKKI
ncbi:MAG: Holliday junction resolvase RuvX [Flavobacterium sp. BFFFF2]|nr:MAG: Holliday junction resolvase RuvX [Flavobacterium sp. BFFFF2]